jgi:hypothetical protein
MNLHDKMNFHIMNTFENIFLVCRSKSFRSKGGLEFAFAFSVLRQVFARILLENSPYLPNS